MFTSKVLRCLTRGPTRVLNSPAIISIRCISKSHPFRTPPLVVIQPHHRCASSSSAGNEDLLFTKEDIGEFLDKPIPEGYKNNQGAKPSLSKGQRVKVKFDWKNSLVTADAVNLLENLYRTHPQLVDYDESELVDYLQRMSAFSIEVERASEMALIYPRLLKMRNEVIAGCISSLRSMGLTEGQRKSILRRIPQLVDIPPKRLTKHFSFLKTYLTVEETIEILTKSVDIFLENETSLRQKLDYLIKAMSHETHNISSCKALSYSLKHIKTRHEFLIRAGFFKPIPYNKLIKTLEKEYKDKTKPRDKYFKPLELVCYKDSDFLQVCTNGLLTLNELAAFEELYEAELKTEEDMAEADREVDGDTTDEEEDDDEDDKNYRNAVSLIRESNSVGFYSDAEAQSSYF